MATLRAVSVYLRTKDFIIQPESQTTTGLWIVCEPVDVVPHDVETEILGKAVRNALAACRLGVAHPTDWKAMLQPLLACARIRSWNAFQKSAMMCLIEETETELRIIPNKNGGTKGPDKGFDLLLGKSIIIGPSCSAEELGSALKRAFDYCC